jgi:tetratricopeptide (TPR) repeat protein
MDMKPWLIPVLAGILTLGLATGAWAAGSSSSSSTRGVAGKIEKAQSAIDAGSYRDAIPILEDVVDTDPKNANAHNLLGFVFRNLGDYGKSAVYYDQALTIDPNHKGANEYLGELYLKLGQLKKAEAQLARLDDICTFGCSEYDDLKVAIETYKKGDNN